MEIRNAWHTDLQQVITIYNQAVEAGFQTADIEPWKVEDKQDWFHHHLQALYPLFVAVDDETIVGYIVISPYRPGRGALVFTKEISYYVHKDYVRKGIGLQLVQFAISKAREFAAKTLIAIVLDANMPSIHLLERAGFEKWGHLPRVARFNGVTCGHVYYGLHIDAAPDV